MIINQTLTLLPEQAIAFYYLLDTDIREFWYVGGFGSGKTLCGAKILETVAMRFPKIRIGMIRDTLENLKKTTLLTFLEVVDSRLYNHNKSEKFIKFVNGSEIYYFGLDDEGAIPRLQSLELGFLWVDEVDGIAERVYNIATKRLRQTSPEEKQSQQNKDNGLEYKENAIKYPRKALVTSNSAGQNWTYSRFVEKPYNLTKWIRAISSSNKYLPQEYLDSLEELKDTSPDDYKRYVMAEFNIFEGQIYKEWNEAVHVVDPFDIPESWERVAFMDYGLRNQTAIGYFAIAPDGKCYLYDEYYQAGTTPEIHSADIISHGFDEVIGDPSMLNKNQAKGNKIYAIADEYEENGVTILPAQNDHTAGRSYVKKMLRDNKLFIFRNCYNAIRTLPLMKWKPPRLIKGVEILDEEEAQGQEDHLPDVIRYFCMERCNPREIGIDNRTREEKELRLKNPLLSMITREKIEEELALEDENEMMYIGDESEITDW